MADDSVRTITGTFATREAAERAVEHLVQEHRIHRADIFIQPLGDENSAGRVPSGADANPGPGSPPTPALRGLIQVSAEVADDKVAAAEADLREAGARDIATR